MEIYKQCLSALALNAGIEMDMVKASNYFKEIFE
jgi:hypothetical protein